MTPTGPRRAGLEKDKMNDLFTALTIDNRVRRIMARHDEWKDQALNALINMSFLAFASFVVVSAMCIAINLFL